MVLQGIVVVEVLSAIELVNSLRVVVGVHHRLVLTVATMRIAVDGEQAQPLEPLSCQRIVGEQSQRGSQHIGLPSVLLGFGVASIARGNRTVQFVVAFRFQEFFDVSALRRVQPFPLEKSRIGHTHRPKRTFPNGIACRCGAPVVVARAHLQFVGLVGGIGENQRFHRHIFHISPRHASGQRHLSFGIFHKESANHSQVGIRTHATLVVGHRVLTLETATSLAHAVRSHALLEIILHIQSEVGQHLQKVSLHLLLAHKVGGDNSFGGTVGS